LSVWVAVGVGRGTPRWAGVYNISTPLGLDHPHTPPHPITLIMIKFILTSLLNLILNVYEVVGVGRGTPQWAGVFFNISTPLGPDHPHPPPLHSFLN